MLEIYAKKIEHEEATDVLSEMTSEGYLPGQQVSRHLLIPVDYPFGPDRVTCRYSSYPDLCLEGFPIEYGPTLVPLDESPDDPSGLMRWALVEVSGTIPEGTEPDEYRCDFIQLDYEFGSVRLDGLFDLYEDLPADVVDQARWPRDIYVGWK